MTRRRYLLIIPFLLHVLAEGQQQLPGGKGTVSMAESGIQGSFQDLTGASLDVTGTNAVLVVAGFDTRYGGAVNTREGMYRLTGGGSHTRVFMHTLRKSGGADRKTGSMAAIFDVSGNSGSVTFTLQHSSSVRQPVLSTASMVAIGLTTTESRTTLDHDMKTLTAPVPTSPVTGEWKPVGDLITGAILLPVDGDIYVGASVNALAGSEAVGEWKLQYAAGQGTWTDLGSTATEYFTPDGGHGIASLAWVAGDLPAGSYTFRVVQRQTAGSPGTISAVEGTLVACGLVFEDGTGAYGEFTAFASANPSTTSALPEMEPVITQVIETAHPASLFLQSQYTVTSDNTSDSPAHDLYVDNGVLDGPDLYRYIATPADRGSGGNVDLALSLQPGIAYGASLRHRSTVEDFLTTRQASLCGFLLTSSGKTVWTGAGLEPTRWENGDNWAGGIPGQNDHALIPGGAVNQPVLSSISVIGELTIKPGGMLFIGPTGGLTVKGELINQGELTIRAGEEGTGSLIPEGTASGPVSVESYLTAGQWHITSPPVSGQPVASFLLDDRNKIPWSNTYQAYGLTSYNEATNSWNSFYTASEPGEFEMAAGYLMRRDPPHGPVTYTGTLNGPEVLKALASGASGWNAVGNPYPSAIGVTSGAATPENVLDANLEQLDPSYGVLYIWEEEPDYSGAQNNYKVIGNAGYVVPGAPPELDLDYLQAGQGFLVKAAQGGGPIRFAGSMQTHATGQAVLKRATDPWDGFQLVARSGERSESAIICFGDGMSRGLDPSYDAGLLQSRPGFSVYSRLVEGDRGIRFGIQCLPESWQGELSVPVGIELADGGEVTLFTEGVRLPDSSRIFLEDRLTGTLTELTGQADTFRVVLDGPETGSERFFLRLTMAEAATPATDIRSAQGMLAVFHRQELLVLGDVKEGSVARLLDIRGREVGAYRMEAGNRNRFVVPHLKSGIYILVIQHDRYREVIKVWKSE